MGKKSPGSRKLEEMLRSSKMVAGGFMGFDTRSVEEVIETDLSELASMGKTREQLAEKMQEITDAAESGFGAWVKIGDNLKAMADEAMGFLICPFAHPGRFRKRVTIVTGIESGRSIKWSDLNIHFIAEHGFFEGVGSEFRLEPRNLVEFLF